MTRPRGGRLLRGLAALATLTVTLAGVPIGLTALGQPPPSRSPSWPALAHGLTHNLGDGTLLRAVALLCWLVWVLFVLAVTIEVVLLLLSRGRRLSVPQPRFGVPGLQQWARALVLTAALLLPQRGMGMAVAAARSGARPAPAVATMAAPAPDPSPATRSTAVVTPTSSPVPGRAHHQPRYVVRRYDSPWSIAERHLGSGARWREIRDEKGRLLAEDGARARIIHPGQVLLLPSGPAVSGRTASQAPLGRAAPPRPPALPRPAVPNPHAALAAPSPPPAAPPPAATATTTLPTPAPGDPSKSDSPPTMVAVAADRSPAGGGVNAQALVEAGLVGAAALGVIRVLRRRQAQHRPFGRRIRLPGPALGATEVALRHTETPDRMLLVEQAMASLTETLRAEGPTPPGMLGVLVDDAAVEVLLSHPASPPPGWAPSAEGFRWRIDHSALAVNRPLPSAPLPALASIGRVAAGTADALINLEAAGLVGVTGDTLSAAGLVYALAAQLVGAPWARAVNLVLVGFPPGLTGPDNVRGISSIIEVAEELRATAEIMSATVRQQGCPDVVAGRLRGVAGDGWPPVVVLSARPLPARELEVLIEMARPGSGVAAVVINPGPAARWTIDASARPCPVTPLRLAVNPVSLDPATVAAIAELIAVAEDDNGVGLDEPPYDRVELTVEHDPQASLPLTAPADTSLTMRLARLHSPGSCPGDANGTRLPDLCHPPIVVRVLGSVEVDGAAEFKRAKSRELVVYLAMHPNGVGEAELDEALWGSSGVRLVAASTRDATVSVARTALGGAPRLLPAQGQGREKRYQLGPEVQSDWSQFCVLHRFGREHRSTAALRRALELVRGRPFEAVISGRTYGWIHTEGHARHIEAEVADAADLAAGMFLQAGNPLDARWSARRGLIAEPYTERLWVRLMEAADALGESQEIERIMDEMDVVLELDGDFTGLHPNTLAAYDRLSRRHRFPAGTRQIP